MPMIKLTASDSHSFNAYRASPEGKPRGGVVVIQEVWGVNRWVRSVADRYAKHGFVAVAPAMFDRLAPGFESEDYAAGSAYATMADKMKGFDIKTALLDVAAAVKQASAGGKVGITGYCFGGMITWRSANAGLGLSAGSGYYGGGIPNYLELAPKMPLEMHYGDKDTGIPVDQVEMLCKRYPDLGIFLYPADHGFCTAARPDKYDAASAKKANARTLEFFAKHLA